jgi:hypothetical protein
LLVAETGSWQDGPDLPALAKRCASYAETHEAVPCADIAGGISTIRAHFKDGKVAVLGGAAPDDVSAVLNSSAVAWENAGDAMPADVEMVYVSPICPGAWESFCVEQVVSVAAQYPELPFVVDERWFEFTGQTVAEAIPMCPNLIALRSMGPAFGLDGLGAGFMLGAHPFVTASIIHAAEVTILPLACRAAFVALKDQGYMKEYVESRAETRSWLSAILRKLGFETRELPGPHLFISGDIPDPFRRLVCVSATYDGWLWAVGTPDTVEDQLALLEQKNEAVEI